MPDPDAERERLVGELPLFASLSTGERRALAAIATIERVSAGALLFHEGDPPGDVYVVARGRVTLCTAVPGRGESCFLTISDGELLGWSGLLRKPRVATGRAAVDTTLLRLPASELLELCETDTRVGYAIMTQAFEELADRLQDTRLQLLDIFGKPGS